MADGQGYICAFLLVCRSIQKRLREWDAIYRQLETRMEFTLLRRTTC